MPVAGAARIGGTAMVEITIAEQIILDDGIAPYIERCENKRRGDTSTILARRTIDDQRRISTEQFCEHSPILAVKLFENAKIKLRHGALRLLSRRHLTVPDKRDADVASAIRGEYARLLAFRPGDRM